MRHSFLFVFSIAGIDIEERVPEQYIYKYPVQDNYHVNVLTS